MDEKPGDPYSWAMLRNFLALLAICAGLVAVAEPARAAVSVVETVRQVERTGLACTSAPAGVQNGERPRAERMLERSRPCPRPTVVLIVPTVMLRVDRAHE
ncbi:MAG: hypothetical protein B7Z08_12015 [Sphingomonadales bacterium 32-68-7]|nr:MAG: hypothetical protein B7Z33_13455 [Sphingomonadales bacterium 12-68-11]OYX07623.1 MAG: hypothetical protein B7Z08_12015 [Sphingomonadales bacterium 32-68-7]